MTSLKPQSILSSRVFTSNILKVDESRKADPVQRGTMNINLANLKNKSLYKEEAPEGYIDESNNNNASVMNSPKKFDKQPPTKIDDFERKSLNFDEKILKSKQNSLFISCNRLMHSKNCGDELPIIISEIILIVFITFDMFIRIFITGCKNYFRKCINWLDLILLILSVLTIFLYLKLHSVAQKIEDISFALLIFIRNSSQLLRLYILLKNQKEVRKNIEEIIHFSSEFSDKKMHIGISKEIQHNPVLSYVDGHTIQNHKKNKHFKFENFQDNDII